MAGLAAFALASCASGLAGNTAMLIAARGLQGIGGAAMYATTIALLNSSYQGRDRGIAFGTWGAVSGAAAASGPILGGLLTESASWRWIFFVNLPVCAAAIVMSLRAFPADRPDRAAGLDLPGLATFTLGAAAATYGLIRAAADGWGALPVIGMLALGIAAFAVFALIERRVSPVRAGLEGSAPLSLTAFVVSVLIGRFLHASSPRWIIGGGMLLVGTGALLQAMLNAQSGGTAPLPGLIVAGAGVGLATPTLVSNAMSAVPQRSGGMAAGAVNTARQLGFTFGIAVVGSAFSARMTDRLRAGASLVPGRVLRPAARAALGPAVSGGQAQAVLAHIPAAQRAGLGPLIRAASASGLSAALQLAGVLGIAGGIVAIAAIRRPAAAAARPQGLVTAQCDHAGRRAGTMSATHRQPSTPGPGQRGSPG